MSLTYGKNFQSIVIKRVAALLVLRGIERFAVRPLDDGEGSLVLNWDGSDIELFSYPDGAGFAGPRVDVRFERYDFARADDMIVAIEERAKEYIVTK